MRKRKIVKILVAALICVGGAIFLVSQLKLEKEKDRGMAAKDEKALFGEMTPERVNLWNTEQAPRIGINIYPKLRTAEHKMLVIKQK